MKRRIQPKRIGSEKEEKEGLWFVLSKYNHRCLWSKLFESKPTSVGVQTQTIFI